MRHTNFAMARNSPDPRREPGDSGALATPPAWAEQQEELAEKASLSLLLVEGEQPPQLLASNNNSICHTIQSSRHASLCEPFCGEAHSRALAAGQVTFYRCHAGLHCFAAPVQIGARKDLAIIGGRAFLQVSDYKATVDRLRQGDLSDLFAEETFDNVIFGTHARLRELAGKVQRSAHDFILPTAEVARHFSHAPEAG